MNRQQRRLAARTNKKKARSLNYDQKSRIAKEAYSQGHAEGREVADTDQGRIFMYVFALVLKTLHSKWGWGHVRLARLTDQVLEEYNKTDMSLDELEQWCWDYGGFKLQIDEDKK